uniref:Candidate secreted effector n=1 Tax=Meloidogyne incognita TaxID=6306 RepID=A0A914KVK2_MELIC
MAPIFRSLSVSSLSSYRPPPTISKTYSIKSLDDVSGTPKIQYIYYYPYYCSYYPSYRYNSVRTYVNFYNRHYSNWPEHHFNYPFNNYKPLSFYGSYTYAPYKSYKNPSGYYYGWYNGPLDY